MESMTQALDSDHESSLTSCETPMSKHEPKFQKHLGYTYLIVADFPDSDSGTKSANRFMDKHPNACVLVVQDGRVILANQADKGTGTGADNLSAKAKRAVKNYGVGVCLDAYRMTDSGDGARTIATNFNLTTNQADAAIDAGRELAGFI